MDLEQSLSSFILTKYFFWQGSLFCGKFQQALNISTASWCE